MHDIEPAGSYDFTCWLDRTQLVQWFPPPVHDFSTMFMISLLQSLITNSIPIFLTHNPLKPRYNVSHMRSLKSLIM